MEKLIDQLSNLLNVSSEWLVQNAPELTKQLQVYWITRYIILVGALLSFVGFIAACILAIIRTVKKLDDWSDEEEQSVLKRHIVKLLIFSSVTLSVEFIGIVVQTIYSPYVKLLMQLKGN